MKDIPYIVQSEGITVFIDKKSHHISRSSPKYEKVKTALKNKEWDKIESLVSYGTSISKFSNGKLTFEQGQVKYDGKPLPKTLSKRIVMMLEEEMDLEPLIKFIEKIKLNPSYNSVQQTYDFLEENMLPITSDGDILAYKVVVFARRDDDNGKFKRGDLIDRYSNSIRNNIGDEVSMDRNEVDDDPNHLCSFGLHGGSEQYFSNLRSNGNNVMVVIKINPADIVAVPKYHSKSKFRCCKYVVHSYYGNDGNKKLEDEIVAVDGKTSSFCTSKDTRAQVQSALDIAKGMVSSHKRQRLNHSPGHRNSIAGWVGYLQAVKLGIDSVETIADEIESTFGFMTAKIEGGNLYIARK